MPNPTAPPPRARPQVENLDVLIREAMRGGSIEKLKSALTSTEAKAPATAAPPVRPTPDVPVAPAPDVPVARVPAVAPASVAGPAVAGPRLAGPPAAPRTPDAWLAQLTADLSQARLAWERGDARATVQALRLLEAEVGSALSSFAPAVLAAGASAGAHPATEPVPATDDPTDPGADDIAPARPAIPPLLAPIRLAHALVVDGVGDPTRAPELATALGVDIATARSLAGVRHSSVALRSDDATPLQDRARAVRALGLRASVIARATLLGLPSARPVVRVLDLHTWLLGVDDPWNNAADPLGTEGLPTVGEPERLDDVALVTLGEVEVRLVRGAQEGGRWTRSRAPVESAGSDRRRAVVDLHTPTAILRVVEGMTDLARLVPGEPNRSALKRLIESVPDRWPSAVLEPRRVCAANHEPLGVTGARLASGWPTWEEHTRLCRLHQGV